MNEGRKMAEIFSKLNELLFSHKKWYVLVKNKGEINYKKITSNTLFYNFVNEENYTDSVKFDGLNYAKRYKHMLGEGEIGIFGYSEGEWTYRVWVKRKGKEKYLRRTILDLNSDDAYIHYCYTNPEKRGKGIHTLGIQKICELFPDCRLVTLVDVNNIASIKGFETNGFYKYKEICVLCIVGIIFKHEKIINENNLVYEMEIENICSNIKIKGLKRYDARDISVIENRFPRVFPEKYKGKLLRGLDILIPRILRKIFQIQPSDFPTTYTFLAEAYFWAIQDNQKIPLIYTDIELMDKCLNLYYDQDGRWKFEKNTTFYVQNDSSNKEATMPLYGLSRCNNLLARMGKYYHIQRFISISYSSLCSMFKQHNIFEYENGTKSISYYYNSNDCTINVNTEVLDWISSLPKSYINYEIQSIFNDMLKFVIEEQDEDGSWSYFSKQHMNQYNVRKTVDCHHTATVLYNLIHVIEGEYVNPNLQSKLEVAILNGIIYFLDTFFDSKTGKGITIVGKRRKASSVQYAEALVAICSFVECEKIKENSIKERCKNIMPLIAKQLAKLVKNDGSAPGDSVIYPINIDSINWGNGAVLWALIKYRTTLHTLNENIGNYEESKRNEIML